MTAIPEQLNLAELRLRERYDTALKEMTEALAHRDVVREAALRKQQKALDAANTAKDEFEAVKKDYFGFKVALDRLPEVFPHYCEEHNRHEIRGGDDHVE